MTVAQLRDELACLPGGARVLIIVPTGENASPFLQADYREGSTITVRNIVCEVCSSLTDTHGLDAPEVCA